MIYMIFSKNPILELPILCYLDTDARDGTEFFSSQSTFLMTTFPPWRHYTFSLFGGNMATKNAHWIHKTNCATSFWVRMGSDQVAPINWFSTPYKSQGGLSPTCQTRTECIDTLSTTKMYLIWCTPFYWSIRSNKNTKKYESTLDVTFFSYVFFQILPRQNVGSISHRQAGHKIFN